MKIEHDLRLEDIAQLDQLREHLFAIAQSHGDGSSNDARNEVMKTLRDALKQGRDKAETMLFEDGKGLACAKRLAHLQDVIVKALYDYALQHVFKVTNMTKGERLAVVAIGGYGRRTMAPGSDVDLLFLLPYKQTPLGEQIAEYILYMLWDLSLKVGHATRNVDECLRLSREDMTICTSLLEARLLAGDADLFNELEKRYGEEIIDKISSRFIKEKLAERDERHERMGNSRYVVEPNVKEGKGALRDLHTLFWISKMFYRVRKRNDLATKGVFNRPDFNLFVKCEDFLWAVRCHLHFLTGRADERLSFEVQRDIAARLGYQNHPGMQNVERFMKHFFLITKDVGDLTRIFCSSLEEQDIKQTPGLNQLFKNVMPSRRVRKIRGEKDFIIDNQRINAADTDVFKRDPVNLIRIFAVADRQGLEYHPDALRLMRRSLKYIKATVRNDPEANALFLKILTSTQNPELNLRRMNEAGVLGRFMPDFGKIIAMMQFNMYHHFTVDEHLIQTVGMLSRIENGHLKEENPLASRLVPGLSTSERTLLFVTLLLHDIAKGQPEDHSTGGARVARRLCPRLGLSAEDTETVAWLIEEHLTMSTVAQSRDLSDRRTITDFANRVQSLRRLKLLLILTVCDIRAVGPGVWNGWKGQLLRTLYAEAELAITGGYSEANRDSRAEAARKELSIALEQDLGAKASQIADLHYPAYLLSVDIAEQIRHSLMLAKLRDDGEHLHIDVRTDAFQAITEITVVAPDHPRLLAVLAAACATHEAKIDSATAYTTTDGRAIDTLLITRSFDNDADEMRRMDRIVDEIRGLMTGRTRRADIERKTRKSKRNAKAFHIEPLVRINNSLSARHSVIQLESLDRPGLLYDITSALSDLALDIRSAHITTFGEKAVDSFYVTDLIGQKITSKPRETRILERLSEVLQPDYSGETASPMISAPANMRTVA